MSNKELREAFLSGVQWADGRRMFDNGYVERVAPSIAGVRYPTSEVTQPREVKITFSNGDSGTYRFVNGRFEMKFPSGWDASMSARIAGGIVTFSLDNYEPEAVVALMELYANPTETIEVDG